MLTATLFPCPNGITVSGQTCSESKQSSSKNLEFGVRINFVVEFFSVPSFPPLETDLGSSNLYESDDGAGERERERERERGRESPEKWRSFEFYVPPAAGQGIFFHIGRLAVLFQLSEGRH